MIRWRAIGASEGQHYAPASALALIGTDAVAKARPGKINFINGGNGTSPTLGVLRLQKNTALQMVGVGYKGFPPAIPDLISGQLQFGFVPFGVAAPHVKSGKLRALAIAAPTRSKQFPDVPTIADAGLPDSPVISWYAWMVPAATPNPQSTA